MGSENTELKTFEVRAKHEVYVTYAVVAEGYDDAVRRLCGIHLFAEYGESMFGPDDYVLAANDIRVLDTESYPDPSPAGRQQISREWEVDEVARDDEVYEGPVAARP